MFSFTVENQKQKTKSGIDDNLLPRGVATHDFKPKSSEEIALMVNIIIMIIKERDPIPRPFKDGREKEPGFNCLCMH